MKKSKIWANNFCRKLSLCTKLDFFQNMSNERVENLRSTEISYCMSDLFNWCSLV